MALYILPRIRIAAGNGMDKFVANTKGCGVLYESVTGMDRIGLGKVRSMYLYSDALYLLSNISTADGNEIKLLCISIAGYRINNTIVNCMDPINIGKVENISLGCAAFCLLPIIKTNKNNKVKMLTIYAERQDIATGSIGNIDLRNIEGLHLNGDALSFLTEGTIDLTEIETLEINTWNLKLDRWRVNEMEPIHIGKIKCLSLYCRAFHILPKIKRTEGMRIEILQ
eukprot:GHVP01023810.1.p2 GENE.GHVP01023810.1~~GHVP01023810.1.p2  ORF type:complete len:226 (-),score=32.63 GHVP01023810.1:622-1299(-)